MKCGFGYNIGRKYRPIWVSVSVSDLNQNSGFGRTLVDTYTVKGGSYRYVGFGKGQWFEPSGSVVVNIAFKRTEAKNYTASKGKRIVECRSRFLYDPPCRY